MYRRSTVRETYHAVDIDRTSAVDESLALVGVIVRPSRQREYSGAPTSAFTGLTEARRCRLGGTGLLVAGSTVGA